MRRMMEASEGKMPTTSARRFTSLFNRSSVFVECSLVLCCGGYLNRNHDPPPGNIVVWRGLTRLHDIARGINIGSKRRCG